MSDSEKFYAYICEHTGIRSIKKLISESNIICYNQESENFCKKCTSHSKDGKICETANYIKISYILILPKLSEEEISNIVFYKQGDKK